MANDVKVRRCGSSPCAPAITGKPTTDIHMLGHACTPGQAEATALDVGLTVGKVGKTIRVSRRRVSDTAPRSSVAAQAFRLSQHVND